MQQRIATMYVAHKRTRCVIERTYGIWKMRFRCLHKTGGCLTFSPKRNVNIIVATGILHNKCVRRNIPLPDDSDDDDDDRDNDNDGDDDDDDNDGDDSLSGEDDSADEQDAMNVLDGRQTRANLINSAFR